MSNKKMRNKPCPCGSSKKFKNCCMRGKKTELSASANSRPTVEPSSLEPLSEIDPLKVYLDLALKKEGCQLQVFVQ